MHDASMVESFIISKNKTVNRKSQICNRLVRYIINLKKSNKKCRCLELQATFSSPQTIVT